MKTSVQLLGVVLLYAFIVTKIGHFRQYWTESKRDDHSAEVLLNSEVCTDYTIRVHLRKFDQCAEAEILRSIGPMQRAWLKVGEDLHICGHSRCEILYVDVTDRLGYVVVVAALLLVCLSCRYAVEYRKEQFKQAMGMFVLPTGVQRIKHE